MKTASEYVQWIVGKKPIPDAKDFVWEMNCTNCKEVMRKGRCVKKDCKYFNK